MRGLDQLFQSHKAFPCLLHTASKPDEFESDFHDVVWAAVSSEDSTRFPPPYDTASSASSQLVKGGFKGPLVDFLAGVGLFDRRQGGRRLCASVRLLEVPDGLGQIENSLSSPSAARLSIWMGKGSAKR
jgi:hypothetical protein